VYNVTVTGNGEGRRHIHDGIPDRYKQPDQRPHTPFAPSTAIWRAPAGLHQPMNRSGSSLRE
jgi:hypothetical protein